MTTEQLITIARKYFGDLDYAYLRPDGVGEVHLSNESTISFDALERFAAEIDTKAINIRHIAETGPWSEITPGDPAQVYLEIVWHENNAPTAETPASTSA